MDSPKQVGNEKEIGLRERRRRGESGGDGDGRARGDKLSSD